MSTSPRLAQRWLGPVLLALVLTATSSARAEDGILTWIVKSISSDEDGEIIPAAAMQVPQVGTALAVGQRISTGAGERMVLVNGRDLVEVRPNTTVTIGDSDSATPDANVDLVTGTIHVEVGKRAPGQTFSVGARYLVATVKGTQFTVSSSSAGSAVSVTEGVVGVSSVASGESVDVTAGNTATVKRGAAGAPSLAPTLAPTPASNMPSSLGHGAMESASADVGGGSGGASSGGAKSGGSNSGGSSSSGSGDAGSGSGGSADSGSGGSGSDSGGLGGAVGDAVGGVGDAVGGASGAVGDAVGDATGAVGGAIGGSLGGAVSDTGDTLGGAVSDVGGAVDGAVSGLGGALGGAVGGLGGALGGKK